MQAAASPSTPGGRMATSNNGPSASQVPQRPKRVDTQDLKSKLASALGPSGKRYWSALLQFMTARIDRTEFEEEAMMCLKPQHVHLHNSLVLGLLFNASADVPGPSARPGYGMHYDRDAKGQLIDKDGNVLIRFADADDADGDAIMLQPPKKRMRLLAAGLSRKERARIRNIPKHLLQRQSASDGGASSLGWAGVGADMLEKKRKEEDRRRSAEEKQRAREANTEIGARDWRFSSLQAQARVAGVHEQLSMSVQQEIARALAAPLCVESKQLPDLERMRDILTLHAVEAGLPQGAQPQAAAMMLAALHSHLQNVMSSIITKIRANRQMGIRVTGIEHEGGSQMRLLTDGNGNAMEDESYDSLSVDDSPMFQRRTLHPMLHDSSSVSSGSASLGVLSGADSSVVSLVSTAPTSVQHGSIASSDNASNVDGANGSNLGLVKPNESYDEEEGDLSASIESDIGNPSRFGNPAAPKDGTSTVELRHMSFLFDIAPHTVVESLGQGSHERLLAADWTSADEQAQRRYEASPEGAIQRLTRLTANAKMSGVAAQVQSATASNGKRNAYIVDQLAPIRLFDRKTLAETHPNSGGKTWSSSKSGGAHPSKGGLSLPRAQYGQKGNGQQTTAAAAATSGSENSSADDPPISNGLNAEDGGGRASEPNADENHAADLAADLAAIIASRYGGQTSLPIAVPQHHRSSQDAHLYEVVDPAALLSSVAA